MKWSEIRQKMPDALYKKAESEAYAYFDKFIHSLTKQADGTVDPKAHGLADNKVDAFRHAYVSGVFTQEYNETAANIFGRLNEYWPSHLYSNLKNPKAYNMDLWNNSIGRKYGKKTKSRQKLLEAVHEALKQDELITNIDDSREYGGAKNNPINQSRPVIVLVEDDKGRNEIFFDLVKKQALSRSEFVSLIKTKEYPGYTIKNIHGIETPVSNPDSRRTNNLD